MHKSQYLLHDELEDEHWWFVVRRQILQDQINRYLDNSSGTLAEIGCGTGGNLKSFQASGFEVIGVDTDATALALAREKVLNIKEGDFREQLATDWPRINVLLLPDVLEHVTDDAAFLLDSTRHLTKGTLILITVPALPSLWSHHDVVLGHHRRYTRVSLNSLISTIPGIKLDFLSYFNTVLLPAVVLLRLIEGMRKRAASEQSDLHKHSAVMNYLLAGLFSLERPLLRAQLPLPLGASLLAVARRC